MQLLSRVVSLKPTFIYIVHHTVVHTCYSLATQALLGAQQTQRIRLLGSYKSDQRAEKSRICVSAEWFAWAKNRKRIRLVHSAHVYLAASLEIFFCHDQFSPLSSDVREESHSLWRSKEDLGRRTSPPLMGLHGQTGAKSHDSARTRKTWEKALVGMFLAWSGRQFNGSCYLSSTSGCVYTD